MKLAHESKYHILVLLIYVFFCAYFLFFSTRELAFDLNKKDLNLVLPLVFGVLVAFYVINKFLRFGELTFKKETPLKVFLLVLYATAFAVPEEIIFRGLLQSYLVSMISNTTWAIIFSSLIYGFAHFQNGATNWRPQNWNWKFMAFTVTLGLFLGYSFHLTGSLAIPILLHAIFIIFNQAFVKTT